MYNRTLYSLQVVYVLIVLLQTMLKHINNVVTLFYLILD